MHTTYNTKYNVRWNILKTNKKHSYIIIRQNIKNKRNYFQCINYNE